MVRRLMVLPAIALLALATTANAQDADYAKKAAARALPESLLSSSTIMLRQADGSVTTVQEGTNGLSCMVTSSDRRGVKNRLTAICAPPGVRKLRAKMAEIRKASKDDVSYHAALAAAVMDGTITLPRAGATGYGFMGDENSWGKDPSTLGKGFRWQFILEPMTTGKLLGLPEKPNGTMPWLMASGTPFSHIMVFGSTE